MFQDSKQVEPGIKIFFTKTADLNQLNEVLTKEYFGGSKPPVDDSRLLILPLGGYTVGGGAIQFYCYRLPSKDFQCFLGPAFPFFVPYDAVVFIKDLNNKTLWQNWDYNEDGSLKEKEKE
jgi:hypothetical protein